MTRLIKFDAAVAGYRPGDVVDLDAIEADPRVDAALEAGYAARVTKADVDDGTVVLDSPPAPLGAAPAAAPPAPPPAPKAKQKAT